MNNILFEFETLHYMPKSSTCSERTVINNKCFAIFKVVDTWHLTDDSVE